MICPSCGRAVPENAFLCARSELLEEEEAACSGGGPGLAIAETVEFLTALVEKSLVLFEPESGRRRGERTGFIRGASA